MAVQALRENAAFNHVTQAFTRVQCIDAYEFLTDLGLATTMSNSGSFIDDGNHNSIELDKKRRLPDHVVMNYPLEAPQFLGALQWWPAKSSVEPRIHVYTFARASECDDAGVSLSAEDVAVNLVAENLIPTKIAIFHKNRQKAY